MSVMNLPTQSEISAYKIFAEAAAANPHWRQLAGEAKGEKLSQEAIIGTIFSVMLLAREIGLQPMQAVAWGIHNIKGKFELSARGMNQLIRSRGHSLKIKMHTERICIIWGKRKDTAEEHEVAYTIEEARLAGLVRDGGGWTKHPKDMLFARALSCLGRRLFADCIGGFYIEGELQETVLKQPIEQLNVQEAIDEIQETEVIEAFVMPTLNLPNDIDASRIQEFIEISSKRNNSPVDYVIKTANMHMDEFVKRYQNWLKQNPQQIAAA